MSAFTRNDLQSLTYKEIKDLCVRLDGPKFLKNKDEGILWLEGKTKPDTSSPARVTTPNTPVSPIVYINNTNRPPSVKKKSSVAHISVEDLNRVRKGSRTSEERITATVTSEASLSPWQLTTFKSTETVLSIVNENVTILNLLPHEDNLNHVIANSSSIAEARVVSFQGVTHAGKSTLLHDLIASAPLIDTLEPDTFIPNSWKPTVAKVKVNTPTSSGIRYYPSTVPIDDKIVRAIYLDIEGHAGSNDVPVDEDAGQGELPTNYGEMRRGAANEQLPRMAYVTSDVIVLVDRNGFSTDIFLKRVKEIAVEYALSGVMQAERPSLILVHNASADEEEWDPKATTEEYLKNHDPGTEQYKDGVLRSFYGDVCCVAVPHKRVFPEQYEAQIVLLRKMIGKMLKRQSDHKKQTGTPMSECLWAIMFSKCIKKVSCNKPIFMTRILAETIAEISEDDKEKARLLFMTLTEVTPTDSSFLYARKQAMRMFAVYLMVPTVQAIEDMEQADKASREVIMSKGQIEARQKDANEQAGILFHQLGEFAPCKSTLFLKIANSNVRCLKMSHNHGNQHENKDTEMEYSNWGIINWFKKAKRFVFRQKYHANWEGEFVNPDLANLEPWYEFWQVFNTLNTKKDITINDIVVSELQLTKEALEYVRDHGAFEEIDVRDKCISCFRNAGVRRARCGHLLCLQCFSVVKSMGEAISPLNGEKVRDLCSFCQNYL